MMKRRKLFGYSMAAALSLAATAAAAQFGRRGKGDKAGGKGGEQVNMFEVTLHEFHEDLKLRSEQELVWGQYVDRLRALADDVSRERRQTAQLALLQRIDRTVDVARDRLTAVEDIALAAKALYAQLTPEQREIADPRLASLILMPLAGAQAPGAERAPRDRGPVSH
jgi:hypothetical protein